MTDAEGHRLGRRHADHGTCVVRPESVEHHHERQPAASAMSGRIGDRVPNCSIASVRVEGARDRRAQGREAQRRARHRTSSLELVEHLLSGEDPVRYELHASSTNGCDRRDPTQAIDKETSPVKPLSGCPVGSSAVGTSHGRLRSGGDGRSLDRRNRPECPSCARRHRRRRATPGRPASRIGRADDTFSDRSCAWPRRRVSRPHGLAASESANRRDKRAHGRSVTSGG